MLAQRKILCTCLLGATLGSQSVFAANTPSLVELEAIKKEPFIDFISIVGSVVPKQASTLSSFVSGIVEQVHVEAGETVQAGDILMSLNDDLIHFEHQVAISNVKEAQIQLAEAMRLLEEAEALHKGRNISQSEVSTRRTQVSLIQAQLSRLSAEETRLKTLREQYVLRAPYSGIISQRLIDTGEWAAQSAAMFVLNDVSGKTAEFRIPESYFTEINEQSRITLPCQGEMQDFVITQRIPISETISRTFLIKTDVSHCSDYLAGVSLKGQLKLPQPDEKLVFSRDAINRYPNGRTTIWVAQPQSGEKHYTVKEQVVDISHFSDSLAVVASEQHFKPGQLIVVRGNEGLVEGALVQVAK